jgi:predicted transposase/invertase (TIGR01784 family)
MKTRSMISFDWAMKRLLRNKANFEVLEGFLSELLHRKIIIQHIGESEGTPSSKEDKTNRVDILVEADNKELVIIELQYFGEDEYFHRILYGASKAITEHMSKGKLYSLVRKVYAISIVYFDLGIGDDYVYHGFTKFTGLHTQNELQLSPDQQELYEKRFPGDLYPEYYLIKVGQFNDIATNTLDEWIYYLKNNTINDDFTAQGMDKAREILAFDKLNEKEKKRYLREIDARLLRDAEIRTSDFKGEIRGIAIGLEKGRAEGEAERARLKAEKQAAQAEKEAAQAEKQAAQEKLEAAQAEKEAAQAEKEAAQKTMALNCHHAGLPIETISTITGFTIEMITSILKNN